VSSSTSNSDLPENRYSGTGFLARTAAAFSLFLLLYFGATEIFIRYAVEPYDWFIKRVKEFRESTVSDAVFGDSRLDAAFLDGFGFVNMAVPGDSFTTIAWKATRYYEKRPAGRVIIQAGPEMLSAERQRPANSADYEEDYSLVILKNRHRPFLLRYWYNFTVARARFTADRPELRVQNVPPAQLPEQERARLANEEIRILRPVRPSEIETSPVAVAYRAMLIELKRRNLNICMASLPFPDDYLRIADNQEIFRQADVWFRGLAVEFAVPLIDARRALPGIAYYRDVSHVNRSGAEKLLPRIVQACFDGSVAPGRHHVLSADGV